MGLTLNKSKCKFGRSKLKFLGHIFSKDGTAPDPRKTAEIARLQEPTTPYEVRSLMGMVTFCAKYIPHLALTARPLLNLTKQNQPWKWTKEHRDAFQLIKEQLEKATQVAYFDKTRSTEIWTDASPTGLGAILVQRDNNNKSYILAFASHALSDTEARYSQIEREALALTWATKNFHLYVFGSPFKIVTDHKPLVNLFSSLKTPLSPRLERWRIKLQPYEFSIEFKPGKANPADYVSRHPDKTAQKPTTEATLADRYVRFTIEEAVPKALTLEEVMLHTRKDKMLSRAIDNLSRDDWVLPEAKQATVNQMKALHKIRQELSTNPEGNVLLRGARLVLPQSLQKQVVKLAHSGHPGISRTKAILREKIWFSGMDRMVEHEVRHCMPCNVTTQQNSHYPVTKSDMPSGPWQEVNVDHKGPLPTGEYLLVIVDRFSKFPIVETVSSTCARVNVAKLDAIFSTFGIPKKLISDNGSPFNSQEFKDFTRKLDITHHRVIPLWPRANGQVERFNRTINKILRIVHKEPSKWKPQMNELLRSYRNTPQSSTGRSPADLMFGYKYRSLIPDPTQLKHPIDMKALEHQEELQQNRHTTKQLELKRTLMDITEGDRVLVKQRQTSKTQPPYDDKPYDVTAKKGPMITAEREDHTITRHESHFKVIPKEPHPKVGPKQEEAETVTEEHKTDVESKELRPPKLVSDKRTMGTPPQSTAHEHNLRTKTSRPNRLIEEC